jgi:3-oxoacyl-[acyl-carrier protein] reductase
MQSGVPESNLNPRFSDQVVLVTGGAQGIGAALVGSFLDAGAYVVAVDLDAERLAGQWEEGDGRVLPVHADVAKSDQVAAAVERALAWQGRIDVAVNNAGITRDTVVWKMSDEQWDAVLGVHLKGTFNVIRAVIPPMRTAGYGRIINVTSYTGIRGNVGQANYAAAKAGIIGITKTVAKETARFGITVNAVSPNAETQMVAAIPPEKREYLISQIPAGRFGQPEEMACAVMFLASAEAAYITGVVLPVDGGLSM